MSASPYFFDYCSRQIKLRDCEFNVSNSNMGRILSALGFNSDFSEMEPVDLGDFMDAADKFINSDLADILDTGSETIQIGNVLHCGVRPGYLQEKVEELYHECWKAQKLKAKKIAFG